MDTASTPWPQILHPNEVWRTAYARGWTALSEIIIKETAGSNNHELAWALFCARYTWRSWPIYTKLDMLPGQARTPAVIGPPLAWLEYELYQLTGDLGRLARRYELLRQWTHEIATPPSTGGSLEAIVHLQALAWMAAMLKHHDQANRFQSLAFDLCDGPLSMAPLDQEMARLWVDPAAANIDRAVTLLQHLLTEHGRQSGERAGIITRCLLLLAALYHHQNTGWTAEIATIAMDACLAKPSLAWLIPPLLIDGIVGCVPMAHEGMISWRLFQPPPIGVANYSFTEGLLSLQASRDAGAGTHLTIDTSVPVLLEIVTEERAYLEVLEIGNHSLTLTILDRTNVKEA